VIFADTGAWFAAYVPNAPEHMAARAWLDGNTEPLVTTDYVIDELLTLLRVRGEYLRTLSLGASLLDEEIARMEWVRPEDVRQAWRVFEQYRDKAWSFTDCVSRVVMERLGITKAFAFDDHFRQFATVTVVPASRTN
jgi:predicted nucleic acid-binding protein